jgi:hypothetical protein
MSGYILNGKFFKGTMPKQNLGQTATYKGASHAQQRKDHARELIQPHLPNGKVNPAFIEAYPQESEERGYLGKN